MNEIERVKAELQEWGIRSRCYEEGRTQAHVCFEHTTGYGTKMSSSRYREALATTFTRPVWFARGFDDATEDILLQVFGFGTEHPLVREVDPTFEMWLIEVELKELQQEST